MADDDTYRFLYPPCPPPKIGVGGIITDSSGRVLLTKRGRSPYQGHWHIPGGAVDPYEELHAALRREIREELGVLVHPITPEDEPVQIVRVIDGVHSRDVLMLLYLARIVDGEVRCLDATADARWFTAEELLALDPVADPVLRGTKTTLRKALRWLVSD